MKRIILCTVLFVFIACKKEKENQSFMQTPLSKKTAELPEVNDCIDYDMKWGGAMHISGLFFELNGSERTENLNELLPNKNEVRLLNISSSNLKTLPKEILEFKNLETLDISDNPFVDLEQLMVDLKKLPNLRVLAMSHCGIVELPDNISILDKLIGLSLDQNIYMVELNDNIGKLKNLKYLNLRRNRRLKSLPKTIGNLKCLEQIVITATAIREINEELTDCQNLKNITANAGKIEYLPDNLGKLKNLRLLNLGANKIAFLPQSIGELSLLEDLSLGSNELEFLPKEIEKLQNLEYLSLDYNRFKTFPKETLSLQRLRNLYVHNNSFTSIPKEVGSLPNLYQLLVDHQMISDENIEQIKSLRPKLIVKKHDGRRLVKGPRRKE